MQLGPAEILVILVVALLVFGPNRLPEVARQVGRGIRDLRAFQQHIRSELDGVLAEDVSGQASPPPSLPPRLDVGEYPTADAPAAGPPAEGDGTDTSPSRPPLPPGD